MAEIHEIKVDANDIPKNMEMIVEVKVVNMRLVRMRLWIALQLCKLASWIGGYGLKINEEVGVIIKDKDLLDG